MSEWQHNIEIYFKNLHITALEAQVQMLQQWNRVLLVMMVVCAITCIAMILASVKDAPR